MSMSKATRFGSRSRRRDPIPYGVVKQIQTPRTFYCLASFDRTRRVSSCRSLSPGEWRRARARRGRRRTTGEAVGCSYGIADKATRARFEEELDGGREAKAGDEVKSAAASAPSAPSPEAARHAGGGGWRLPREARLFNARVWLSSSICTLSETSDKSATAILKTALAADDAGGNATLSAACFARPGARGPARSPRRAASRIPRSARRRRGVCRRESKWRALTLALMIKESHCIPSICTDLSSCLHARRADPGVRRPGSPCCGGAERHPDAGSFRPTRRDEGRRQRSASRRRRRRRASVRRARAPPGPRPWRFPRRAPRSRRAWAPSLAGPRGPRSSWSPVSDRPSADRDTTFRMAACACPELQADARGLRETGRASRTRWRSAPLRTARDHGRDDLRAAIIECATDGKRGASRRWRVAARSGTRGWSGSRRDPRKARGTSRRADDRPRHLERGMGALVRSPRHPSRGRFRGDDRDRSPLDPVGWPE